MKKPDCHCEEPQRGDEAISKTASGLLRPKGLAMTHHPSTLKLVAGIATLVAAVLAGHGRAEAQGVEFPPEINYVGPVGTNLNGNAHIISSPLSPDRFSIIWSGSAYPPFPYDIYEAECRLEDNPATGGAKIRLISPVAPVSDLTETERYGYGDYMRILRQDGTVTHRIFSNGSTVTVNGNSNRWSCSDLRSIDTSPIPGNMRWVLGDTYDVPLNAADLCMDATKVTELSTAYEELFAPCDQTNRACAPTIDKDGAWGARIKTRISTGTLKHLRRVQQPDGSFRWTQEPTPTVSGGADFLYPIDDVKELRTSPSGRRVKLWIPTGQGPSGDFILKALVTDVPADDGSMNELPLEMTVDPAPAYPDSDGDGTLDRDDNCPGRANPEQADKTGPNGTPDGIGDACQADCGENFPGVSAPGEVNAAGLRVCPSELSDASGVLYANGFSDEDGSTMHSNQDVALDALGNIATTSGQKLRYIHSDYPGSTPQPARSITIPAGDSFRMKIHSTDELDGTPGSVTVTHTSYPDGTVTTDTFTAASDWFEYGVSMGDVVGLEGCDVEIEVGSENQPIDCAHVVSLCPPNPDGGAADGGNGNADSGTSTTDSGTADSGTDGGSSSTDAGGHGPDAGGGDAGTTWTDAGTEYDAGGADATTSTADAGGRDSGHLQEDAGDQEDAGEPATDGSIPSEDAGARDASNPDGASPDRPDTGTDRDAETPQEDANSRDSGHIQDDAGNQATDGNHSNPRADEGNDNGGGCSCEIGALQETNNGMFSPEALGLALGALALKTRRRLRKIFMV